MSVGQLVCDRRSYGHRPPTDLNIRSIDQTWYKAPIAHFGGDHLAIEYEFGTTVILHHHDPHKVMVAIERHGPNLRLLSLGIQDGAALFVSFRPSELVPCFGIENLYW